MRISFFIIILQSNPSQINTISIKWIKWCTLDHWGCLVVDYRDRSRKIILWGIIIEVWWWISLCLFLIIFLCEFTFLPILHQRGIRAITIVLKHARIPTRFFCCLKRLSLNFFLFKWLYFEIITCPCKNLIILWRTHLRVLYISIIYCNKTRLCIWTNVNRLRARS